MRSRSEIGIYTEVSMHDTLLKYRIFPRVFGVRFWACTQCMNNVAGNISSMLLYEDKVNDLLLSLSASSSLLIDQSSGSLGVRAVPGVRRGRRSIRGSGFLGGFGVIVANCRDVAVLV